MLGQGGMGVVLKALDPALDRTVAIKVLAPALAHGATARRRFAREARAAAAVGHEHIVAIHAVDEFRGLPYLVMQYIPGRSLQERLDASGPLECQGDLADRHPGGPGPGGGPCPGCRPPRHQAGQHPARELHRAGQAHRLRPGPGDRRRQPDAERRDRRDAPVHGTRAGSRRAGRRPLGSVLAGRRAVCDGRRPPAVPGRLGMAVLKRVCDDRQRSIRELNPDIPDWLEAIIDRLLAKDPADRFQTAAEVADLLERGLAHVQQPTAVPRPSIPGHPGRALANLDFDVPVAKTPHRSRRRLAVAAGFACLPSRAWVRPRPPD